MTESEFLKSALKSRSYQSTKMGRIANLPSLILDKIVSFLKKKSCLFYRTTLTIQTAVIAVPTSAAQWKAPVTRGLRKAGFNVASLLVCGKKAPDVLITLQ